MERDENSVRDMEVDDNNNNNNNNRNREEEEGLLEMILDREEVAIKVFCESGEEEEGGDNNKVVVKMELEDMGFWVMDTRDDEKMVWAGEGVFDGKTKARVSTIKYDPNGRYCWISDLWSCLNQLQLDPTFHDPVVELLQYYIDYYVGLSKKRFLVRMKNYTVYCFADEEVKRIADLKGWYNAPGVDTFGPLRREDHPGTWMLLVIDESVQEEEEEDDDDDDKLLGLAMKVNELQSEQGCETDDCAICYQHLLGQDDSIVKLQCSHMFHQRCISDWFKLHLSCPLCRSPCLPPS
ncbi:hypothetical protein RND81_04G204800 [Saponaria officinalis]|uniref:RING-type E3 ubiquitin transferase n=1 Tax=Saponaria officinalis TaxID=3572 RepID=A0AAW1LNX6_SAPOF